MEHLLVNEPKAQLDALFREMEQAHLFPLWEALSELVTPAPQRGGPATLWNFDTVRNYLMRAGNLISAQDAERRVLILENPGLPGTRGITTSLYAGMQLILPGEVAPCHRHSQAALRFVMEGDGAFTAVNGEKALMSKFDLILTPGWQWHDHGNPSAKPMIWLDGLDVQTVKAFDASFAEKMGEESHPETPPAGDNGRRYGRNVRPMRGMGAKPASAVPLFRYPYSEWRDSLATLAASDEADPHFGHSLEFLNPADGGSIMPTISAHVRLLPDGFRSTARRATDATVFVVVEGSGRAFVNDTSLKLDVRDVFIVPAWQALRIEADRELVLFGYSDRASQERLGLFRESYE